MYIDAATQTANNAVLNAVLTGSTARTWKILVTQILCSSRTLPPTGCLQYHTGTTGQMRSFNFLATSYQHLNEQYYKICIRREARYCRIGYTASSDPDSFKVSRNPTSYLANTGEGGCGPDTLKIPEGSNNGDKTSCTNPTGTVPTVDFYCGGSLNCVTGKANPSVIITSVSPLRVTKLSLISYFLGTDYHSRWRLTSTLLRQALETEGSVSTIIKSCVDQSSRHREPHITRCDKNEI